MASPGFYVVDGPGWAIAGVRTSANRYSRSGKDKEDATGELRAYLQERVDSLTEALAILDEAAP